jgi:hypothetical protein
MSYALGASIELLPAVWDRLEVTNDALTTVSNN